MTNDVSFPFRDGMDWFIEGFVLDIVISSVERMLWIGNRAQEALKIQLSTKLPAITFCGSSIPHQWEGPLEKLKITLNGSLAHIEALPPQALIQGADRHPRMASTLRQQTDEKAQPLNGRMAHRITPH
ncbi:MAG: hypothetical protein U5L08_07675 [Xanthomonadales bacterium]|nr:hypothetical protein [Xanthomonadales bacterium]